DEGAGVYSLEHTPLAIGPYALVLRFGWQGQEVVSSPTAFEVVRDGEEGIRVEARGTSYVYQVRYNWEPGEAHASDTERVRLVFELMRGIPEGAAIRWDQPWLNAFNHVTNAEDTRVTVASSVVSEALRPAYRGMGVYEAERVFSVAEVAAGREYDVRFTFTDPYNGAHVTHSEPYRLRAVPPAPHHP
ncbi:MAG: hypothetical protein HY688_02530, partial [Chloroflexi bacterium]|nr:hypothetical protein [Chloroflexota bacterium]